MNTEKIPNWIILLLPLLVIFAPQTVFILPQWEQAIITRFGKPTGGPITEAGLHYKWPFMDKVHRLDKRILNWDGFPNQIPTKDKKYIIVDTTARWRISDPLKFIQAVQTENGARVRLGGILEANTRDMISAHNLVEAVRNTNDIIELVKERRKRYAEGNAALEEEEISGEIEPVTVGREHLSQLIRDAAALQLIDLGIELIDVQLRHISYEASVEVKVYERMISERQRIAQKIRSVGKGEQASILGKTSRDLKKIESEAYRTAQGIKGKADSEAIRIYARAMNADPSFYEFTRKLEAYRNSFKANTKMILSTESNFLNLLRKK